MILFKFENDQEKHREKDCLNLNEKYITIILFILKITKSNPDKKTDLICMKYLFPHSCSI